MLGIAYRGVTFPLLFTLLDKRGNANWQERVALAERFIRLFGKDYIDCLTTNREVKPITIKKHGCSAKPVFKHGTGYLYNLSSLEENTAQPEGMI